MQNNISIPEFVTTCELWVGCDIEVLILAGEITEFEIAKQIDLNYSNLIITDLSNDKKNLASSLVNWMFEIEDKHGWKPTN